MIQYRLLTKEHEHHRNCTLEQILFIMFHLKKPSHFIVHVLEITTALFF